MIHDLLAILPSPVIITAFFIVYTPIFAEKFTSLK